MNQVFQNFFNIPVSEWYDFLFLGLASATVIAWFIQLFYYLHYYLSVHRFKKTNIKPDLEPVSVIICAGNEAENLGKNLPFILEQFYPEFQVIVVDEGSKDDTSMVLAELQQKYKHLYVTGIEIDHRHRHTRKLARTIGIKAARYDQLLFTEAGCRPAGPDWIRQIQSNFLRKNDIVLGYGKYAKERKLVNLFIRTDGFFTAQQYFSFALKNNPFTGDGRNLAYRRSLFFNNKGFANQLHLQSGDDDLFINQTASQINTAIELNPDSFTISEPLLTFKVWFRQKRKQLISRSFYRKKHRFMISLEVVSRVYYYVSLIVLLSFWRFAGYLIILALIRLITRSWVLKLTIKRLQEKGIWLFSLVYDFIMPWITGILMLKNLFRKNNLNTY